MLGSHVNISKSFCGPFGCPGALFRVNGRPWNLRAALRAASILPESKAQNTIRERARETTEIERAKTNCAHQEINDSRETKTIQSE